MATAETAFGGGLNSSSGGELKLYLKWKRNTMGGTWTRSPSTSPLGVVLDQIPLNFSLGCGPGPDHPQLPPWVWAWKPARHAGTRPPRDQAPPGPGTPPWTDRHL